VAEIRFREYGGFAGILPVDLGDALDSARLEVGRHIGLGHDVQAGEARAETTRERKAEAKADSGCRRRVDVNQNVLKVHAQNLPYDVKNMIVTVTAIPTVESHPIFSE